MHPQTLEALKQLVVDATSPIFTDEADPTAFYIQSKDGSLERKPIVLPPTNSTVYDLDSLIIEMKKIVGGVHALPEDEVVWTAYVHVNGIVVQGQGVEHKVVHTFALEQTDLYKSLRQLVKPVQYTQKELITALKFNFAGAVNETVIERYRNVKVEAGATGEVLIGAGNNSMRRDVRNKISGADGANLPDGFVVVGDVFERVVLSNQFAVHVDVENKDNAAVFTLRVLEQDLKTAMQSTVEHIKGEFEGLLDGFNIKAFVINGQPAK
jgi:hypothetical protein